MAHPTGYPAPTWQKVRLDDVSARGSGHTPNKKRPDYWNGPIPWISLKDTSKLDSGLITETTETITHKGLANSSAVLHPKGSVVLLRDATIGKTAILGAEMAVSQHFMVWRCGPQVDNWYLYYYLQYMRPEFERVSNGSTIKTIGLDYFKGFTVPLPNIGEQRLIGEVIRDADRLIHAIEALIRKKEEFRLGIMWQLLAGKTRLPGFADPWHATSFGEIGVFLKGRGLKREDVRAIGVPCIRYGELYTTFGNYAPEAHSFVSQNVARTALPLRTGDLLFAGSGETREEIGRCVAWIGNSPAVAGGDLIVLRGNNFNPVYLAMLANAPAVATQKARAGQGDAVVHISSRALGEIRIKLPPREEQDAIALVMLDADNDLRILRHRLNKARSVRHGMMQRLLTGRTRLSA